jgi:hypothetical protein
MRAVRVGLGLLGLAVIGYGTVGLLTDPGTRPSGHLVFLGTVLIGHDFLVLPVALTVGAVLARSTPIWMRGPLQVALYASAVVSVIALPFVIGAGRRPDDPSALPLNYGHGLLMVLAVIWVLAAVTAMRRRAARRAAGVAPPRVG